MRKGPSLALTAALLAGCAGVNSADVKSYTAAGTTVTGSYGGRNYKLYVPASYQSGTPAPLVLLLHGCLQSPDQFAAATGMNALADTQGFLALYPEQPSSANPAQCWQWFDPASQQRGGGEAAILTGMVGQIASSYTVDPDRTFVAGFSAGAGTAVVLGATYPDLFAAIAVCSGLEFKAATSQNEAFSVMKSGGPDPVKQGDAAVQAMGSHKRLVPVIVFHGSSDTTVAPVNGNQVISQWARTNDVVAHSGTGQITDQPAESKAGDVPNGGRHYTRYLYRDSSNTVDVMEKYVVDGMVHAWSGGSNSGNYADPKGPPATTIVWDFFTAHPRGGVAPVDGGVAPDLATGAKPDLATAPGDLGGVPDHGSCGAPDLKGANPDLAGVADLGGVADLAKAPPDLALPPKTAQFVSLATENGYVGALIADGYGAGVLKTGDKGMFNTDTWRVILSFDTSTLPQGAVVKSAKLTLFRKSLAGTVSGLGFDTKNGYFGAGSALGADDYSAPASHTGVATATPPGSDGALVDVALPTAALGDINGAGRTQVRVRATTPVGFNSNVLQLYGGADGPHAPVLTVSY